MPDSFEIAVLLVLTIVANLVAMINLIAAHAARQDAEYQLAAAFRLVVMLEALACEDEDIFKVDE